MGSEILDSSRGTRSVAPDAGVAALPDQSVPVVELDELKPPPPAPVQTVPVRHTGPLGYLHEVAGNRVRRRTTIRTVLIVALLMALTASVVQFRAQHQSQVEQSGRLAVDIRLAEIRPASRSYDLSGNPARGTVTARVELHNLGPEEIRLVGLDVTSAGEVQIANDVTESSTPLAARGTSDTTYNLRLPCLPGQQQALGNPDLTARIRTADRQVHSVPVNVSAVNEEGGLLIACITDAQDSRDPVSSYSSTTDGATVVMTVVVGGAAKRVALVTPNVGLSVRYLTVPRLPTLAQPGIALVVRVTPQVTRCSRTPINFDALPGIGVSIGSEQVQDSYLPALVAQSAGRACAAARR
jgi:hypothetical protein